MFPNIPHRDAKKYDYRTNRRWYPHSLFAENGRTLPLHQRGFGGSSACIHRLCIARFWEKSNVLEIGFGTGLNTFLTFLESQEKGLRINYTTFELYPLSPDITEKLNYPALIAPSSESIFALLHQCEWNQKIAISPLFTLYKRHADLTRTSLEGIYDVVYFDAFAPEKQPEMWDEKIFREIFSHLSPGGILSTYCAKGEIRRRLQSVGFTVERLPGPPNGKREILRASKRELCQ